MLQFPDSQSRGQEAFRPNRSFVCFFWSWNGRGTRTFRCRRTVLVRMILMRSIFVGVVLPGTTASARLRCGNAARNRLVNMNVTGFVHGT